MTDINQAKYMLTAVASFLSRNGYYTSFMAQSAARVESSDNGILHAPGLRCSSGVLEGSPFYLGSVPRMRLSCI